MKLQNQIKRTLSHPKAIVYIRQLLEQEDVGSRTELAEWCCEEFGFQDPRGKNQVGGCLKGLRELEAKGWFKLPPTEMQKGKLSVRGGCRGRWRKPKRCPARWEKFVGWSWCWSSRRARCESGTN